MVSYKSEYYLFFGLGEHGYSGTISKFSLSETVKETDADKKKKKVHDQWHYFLDSIKNEDNSES